MPTPTEFREAAAELQKLAHRYGRFEEDPDAFLEALHHSDEQLRAYREWTENSLTSDPDGVLQIRPVNFLRRVIVDRILEGKQLDTSDLSDIKEAIDNRNADDFPDYPELHEEITNQKDRKRSAFGSWNTFRTLFGIDYYTRQTRVKRHLETIATFLQDELKLDGCDYHLAGFDYNQNYGTSYSWIALYPATMSSHQVAYQITFGIRPDHYVAGLVTGAKVDAEHRDVDHLPADEAVDTSALLKAYRERLPDFYELNREVRHEAARTPEKRRLIRRKYPLNLILHGPPGTGKTYSVQRRAVDIIEGVPDDLSDGQIAERFRHYVAEERVEFTTFHPSYSYEEFIEGFRYDREEKIPVLKDGLLKKLAARAETAGRASSDDTESPHVLIIDEINRGNLARIFGELITLLEPDKRIGQRNELTVRLPYSQEPFALPANLYLIGTMNTADRSIALLDVALRRRFTFEEMMPDARVIENILTAVLDGEQEEAELTTDQVDLISHMFQVLNHRITGLLDRDHQIGHSYFLNVRSMADLHHTLYRRVFPLLQEYFYNDYGRLTRLLGRYQKGAKQGLVKAAAQGGMVEHEPTIEQGGEGFSAAGAAGQAGGRGALHEYRVGELEEVLRQTFG